MSDVKIVILKYQIDTFFIGRITELDEEPSILVENCYKIVDGKLELYPKYSAQRDLFLTSDDILTILDVAPDVLDLYAKTIT